MRLILTWVLCLSSFLFSNIPGASCQGLVGSEKTQDFAIKNSELIFVGTIEAIGPPVMRAIGENRFYGVKITVTKVLRGKVAQHISVFMKARTGLNEASPNASEEYIFFAQRAETDGIDVIKLLPVDNNTLSRLAKLISPIQ